MWRCVELLRAFWEKNKETVGLWGEGEGSKIQLKGYIFSRVELEFQTSWKWPNYNVFVMADGPFTSDPTSFFLTWNLIFRKFSKINIQLSSSGNSLLIISICWEAGLTQSKEILCPVYAAVCGEKDLRSKPKMSRRLIKTSARASLDWDEDSPRCQDVFYLLLWDWRSFWTRPIVFYWVWNFVL